MKNLFSTKRICIPFLSVFMLLTSIGAQAFTDMNGNNDDIENHVGKDKWTIVEIWESSCHMCRKHMPQLVEFNGKLKNTRILGVSIDGYGGVDAAEDFIAEYEINFPNLLTNPVEMNIWMQQNAGEPLKGTPTFLVFDDKGTLVAVQPGVVSTQSLERFITRKAKKSSKEALIKSANRRLVVNIRCSPPQCNQRLSLS